LLVDITDVFDLSFSYSTNSVPIWILNSVINLMFLRYNSLEFNSHIILSELQYSLDYAPLVVDIHITEEFIQDK